jgi:tetratricopeptide (TPR) repeat protein
VIGFGARAALFAFLLGRGSASAEDRAALWRPSIYGAGAGDGDVAPVDCAERLAVVQAERDRQPERTFAHLTDLSRICEKSDVVWAALATVAIQLGQFSEARAALRRARGLAPDSPDPRRAFDLGFLLSVDGQWAAGIEAYRQAERLGGLPGAERWLLDFDLGDSLMALGRLGEALSAYRRALGHAPSEPLVHLALAVALDRADQPIRSRAELKLAERFDPKIGRLDRAHYIFIPAGDIHYYRGLLSMAQGEWQEARRALSAFLTTLPDSPYAGRARDHLRVLSTLAP